MSGPDDLQSRKEPAPEGRFDEQLVLPLPTVAEPEPFREVVKRDGRREAFDKRKIADAILKAAQTLGGQDRDLANSLASAVAIYLTKTLKDTPPHVEQVHDAVERVLIEMAHARTALAYARYRDRRARIRKIREGDMRLLMSEVEEARAEREARGARRDALFVQTSGERLVTWDRERIVAALERETGLARETASVIAIEVEEQIVHGAMKTLTASLVRELVSARLVEHGLEEYRERHRRLGVPVFDAHRIVRGLDEASIGRDPSGTNELLARTVKKEYALAEVFSQEVAEAHLRGALHLHGLEQIDRLHTGVFSVDFLARFGFGESGEPQRADELLWLMLRFYDAASANIAQQIAWEALNWYFAPWIVGAEKDAVARLAGRLVEELAYRAEAAAFPGVSAALQVHWAPPGWLHIDQPTRDWHTVSHAAQQFAWALVDAAKRGGPGGRRTDSPVLQVVIDERTLREPGAENFLRHACEAAAEGHLVHFVMERGAPKRRGELWQMPRCALHQVTLNLPRLALEHDLEHLLSVGLARLVRVAARAHRQKSDFVLGLLANPQGPLSLLAQHRNGKPLLRAQEAVCLVAVEGLHECAARFASTAETRLLLGSRILAVLVDACKGAALEEGVRLVAAANGDPSAGERYITLDRAAFGAKVTAESYSTGVCFPHGAEESPLDAARAEGKLHKHLAWTAPSVSRLPMRHIAPATLADSLRKIYSETTVSAVQFVPPAEGV